MMVTGEKGNVDNAAFFILMKFFSDILIGNPSCIFIVCLKTTLF